MTTLSTYQSALYTIKKLKEALHKQRESQHVAIIGVGCRLPRVSNKNEFWQLLLKKENVITQLPEERWRLLEGTTEHNLRKSTHPYWGGYLSNIEFFDSYFFGITPREALCMDPQQRLLLEVAYEAFEDAGIRLESLSGSGTGVYVGSYGSQYHTQFSAQLEAEANALYVATGNATSIIANRLSYFFDLYGPSLNIDTACSSSLMALHLAWLHLQNKQCDLALVAGVSLNLKPSVNDMLAQAKMLSPDGQCKTFDTNANGYVQGEGVCAVILKPLEKALQDKDRIYGIIAGVGVNQDGKTNGLTAPNGAQQEALLNSVYKSSHIDPTHVGYIESHGTGTFLGDPIEVEALGHVLGDNRTSDRPCWLGSVKTNTGHLEPAAGIVSLIKVVLALEKRKIPAHLNFQDSNPHIPFDHYHFCIPQKLEDWPLYGKHRMGGISGFGFGGTNAHIVIRGLTHQEEEVNFHPKSQPWELFTLSAKNKNALRQLVSSWILHLDTNDKITLDTWCYNSHLKRSHYAYRLALVACDVADLKKKLQAALSNQIIAQEGIFLSPTEKSPRLSNVAYCLEGLTDPQLLETLYETYYHEAAFVEVLERCKTFLEPYTLSDKNIKNLLEKSASHIKRSASLVIAYGVYQVWRNWGIKPKFLIIQDWQGLYLALAINEIFTIEAVLLSLKTESFDPELSVILNNTIPMVLATTGEECEISKIPSILKDLRAKGKNSPLPMESVLSRYNIHILLNLSTQSFQNSHFISLDLCLDDKDALLLRTQALASLYVNGYLINWPQVEVKRSYPFVDLPLYPWQHNAYWPNTNRMKPPLKKQTASPLQGRQTSISPSEIRFEFIIDSAQLPELSDTNNILHVGYYMEMLSLSTHQITKQDAFTVKDLTFLAPIHVPQDTALTINLLLSLTHNKEASFKIFRGNNSETSDNLTYAEGALIWDAPLLPKVNSLQSIKRLCNKRRGNAKTFCKRIEAMHMPIGLSIQWTENYWQGKKNIIAKLRSPLPQEYSETFSLKIHPGLFDACIQPLFMLLDEHIESPYITSHIEKLHYFGKNKKELFLVATLRKSKKDAKCLSGEWYVGDKEGNIVAFCEGIHLTQLTKQTVENLKLTQPLTLSSINLAHYPAVERPKIILDFLQKQVGEIFKMKTSDIDPYQTLQDFGMDSLMAIELHRRIEKSIGIQYDLKELILPITLEQIVIRILSKVLSGIEEDSPKVSASTLLADTNSWIAYRQKVNTATPLLRLFCFPYGGGGSSIYRTWNHFLPQEIEVCPIQLPGRENRITEEPFNNLASLIETLYEKLKEEMEIPYAFYGHSFGALIAFELSRYLQERERRLPEQLFVAAFPSPDLSNSNLQALLKLLKVLPFDYSDPMNLTDNQLMRILKIFNKWSLLESIAGEQPITPAFLKILLPTILADLQLVANYIYKPEPLISVPITAFSGTLDKWVPPKRMKGWKELTTSNFVMREIVGEHLFIKADQQLKEVLELLNQAIFESVMVGFSPSKVQEGSSRLNHA